MQKIHLHLESHYSMSGSNITCNELARKAQEMGFSSLALTDDYMHGVIDFYKSCKAHNIKPIIGLKVKLEGVHKESKNTVLLYAKNLNGYHNLLQLSSLESYNSVVTLSEMKHLSKDVIAVYLSSNSELSTYFKSNMKNEFLEVLNALNDTFKEYLISQSDEDALNDYLNNKNKLVYVSNVLYMDKDDHEVRSTLRKIFSINEDNLFAKEKDYHFRQVVEDSNYEQATKNIDLIIENCNVEIDFDQVYLPSYPVKNNVSSKDYLRALTLKGLEKRIQGRNVNKRDYFERINYELKVIHEMGYDDYFLIVWDFVKYAKTKGYLVGPGRGSAAASLVSYCLGITTIDSIQYDLVFERFLNPERITLPDIDIDLPDDIRDDVIQYVKDFYGEDRVASICTFGTFQSKSAIRDVARTMNIEGVLLEQVVKQLEDKTPIKDSLEKKVEFQKIVSQKPQINALVQMAIRVEGLNKNIGTHAAGIIVSSQKLVNHTAIKPGINGMTQTQYEMGVLEGLGLLKIDFLGLRNLSSINTICELIEQNEGKKIDIYNIPVDDQKTYKLLSKVETVGVFQLESQGMKSLVGQMKMREFEDIVTVLALFRPGPMENIPSYLRRRHGEEKVSYPHPVLEEVLKSTNGIIVYQEQILKIASLFAGYTFGEADVLRRAVSKKLENVLVEERQHFVEKSLQQGHSVEISNEIYDYIVKFSNYGFNRAHSVAYAMVAYWMAYLKANYPKYFISVLTSSVIGSERQTRNYIFEAHKLGVKILPPSVNISTTLYQPVNDDLVFPLLGVKNVGRKNVYNLLEERNSGRFTSYVDFITRTHTFLNKRVLESLIKASALDEFGLSKHTMIERLEDVINFSQLGGFIQSDEFVLENLNEFDFDVLQAFEKDVLGFNLVYNPISKHQDYIKKHNLFIPSTISKNELRKEVRIMALLSFVRTIKTKNGKEMAFVTLSDAYSQIDAVLFNTTFLQYKNDLERNKVYLFKGRIDERNENLQLIIDKLLNMDK